MLAVACRASADGVRNYPTTKITHSSLLYLVISDKNLGRQGKVSYASRDGNVGILRAVGGRQVEVIR